MLPLMQSYYLPSSLLGFASLLYNTSPLILVNVLLSSYWIYSSPISIELTNEQIE